MLLDKPFVKRARELTPNNPNQFGQQTNGQSGTPPHTISPPSRIEENGRRVPVDRPPELSPSHPIESPRLPPVRYEEDRRPSLFQRLTGTGRTKKRTRYEMENDHEAGTSGTKEVPKDHSEPKKQKATAKDVHNYLDTIVEERNRQQKQRNRRYRSPSTRQRENEHWKEIVGGGMAAAGTGIAMVYNTGKKIVKDVKQACIGACRRVDQRIQQHFERQGWSEPSQPVRPGVRRYTPNETPARPGTWQARREELEKQRKKIDQKRLEQKQNSINQVQERQQTLTRPLHLVRSKSAPPNYEKFSRKSLTRSRSSS